MAIISSGIYPINPNVTDGTQLANYINELVTAINSNQASATRPPLITKGGVWTKLVNETDVDVMVYDGTTDFKVASIVNGEIIDVDGISEAPIDGKQYARQDENWTEVNHPASNRNRIINGDMRIDQRNSGASFTPSTSSGYSLDRWRIDVSQNSKLTVQQNAGSVIPPNGFKNYLGITSSSAYAVGADDFFIIAQVIEGYNVADLNLGSSSGQSFTLSFVVRSSLIGTFAGAVSGGGGGSTSATYPFSYTINSANTWETKTITIPATSLGNGWGTTNTLGLQVFFNLGCGSTYGSGTAGAWASGFNYTASGGQSVVGTNGATFYLTGVQLEVGDTATPFEHRPYDLELQRCQRYYWKTSLRAGNSLGQGTAISTTAMLVTGYFPTRMRKNPTAIETTGIASDYKIIRAGLGTDEYCSSVPSHDSATSDTAYEVLFYVSSGLSNGYSGYTKTATVDGFLAWSVEL